MLPISKPCAIDLAIVDAGVFWPLRTILCSLSEGSFPFPAQTTACSGSMCTARPALIWPTSGPVPSLGVPWACNRGHDRYGNTSRCSADGDTDDHHSQNVIGWPYAGRFALQNKKLLELLHYQKSLIYFLTSLESNDLLMKRLQRNHLFEMYPDDLNFLEDVLTTNRNPAI